MRVGLTGGIGSGKSEVANVFRELGAFVIDTDVLAREAVAPGSAGLCEIAGAFPGVVRNGELHRAALADIVFNDPAARERLNAIVHPEVRRLAAESERRAAPGQLVVHVVPLLFETGYNELVDRSVLVTADEAERVRRVMKRDAVNELNVFERMRSQINVEAAKARADFVILNDGDLNELRHRAAAVFRKLQDG